MAECSCPLLPPRYTTRLTSDSCLVHGYKHLITPEMLEIARAVEASLFAPVSFESPEGVEEGDMRDRPDPGPQGL